jgi:hypothetical protein
MTSLFDRLLIFDEVNSVENNSIRNEKCAVQEQVKNR